jgi:hypothetical protein
MRNLRFRERPGGVLLIGPADVLRICIACDRSIAGPHLCPLRDNPDPPAPFSVEALRAAAREAGL